MRIVVIAVAIILLSFPAYALPGFDDIRASYRKSDAVVLDRHGAVIHELRIDANGRRLDWAGIKDLSPSLIKAVIRSEDKRFYEHRGVDWTAMGSAAFSHLLSGTKRGASTITMQLVSMLEKDLRPKGSKRTLNQKWDQISAALELEKHWTKNQILEVYLNLVTFRSELQGIVAASRGLFGKDPSGLNEKESLLLAALIRSPNAAAAIVATRACMLSESTGNKTGCETLHALASEILTHSYHITPHASLAPHVARQLLVGGEQKATSTIDGPLQKFASDALSYQLRAISSQNVHDGAALVIDNKTGEILAYVANSGADSSASHVDGIMAKRQAGSTLKPFLYGLAFERRLLTAASLLDDSPVDVPTPAGLYVPHNYDNDFKGQVSARTALSSSLNVPAVRTLMLVGPDDFVRSLKALGFIDLNEGDYYGLSMALGSVDVSLYELTNAYRTLANAGRWSSPSLKFDRKRSGAQAMSPDAAFVVADILSDRAARGLTFGYENPLSTRFWTAVKTGTSKDMRDNWCIGFSSGYTVGVWIGNFSGAPMWNVSGTSGAAPAWLEIMSYLHANRPSTTPRPPAGVVAKRVEFRLSVEPSRSEWFVRGTEPLDRPTAIADHGASIVNVSEKPAIFYPPKDTIFAVDPDIPDENNFIFFQATKQGQFDWVLNDKRIGSDAQALPWKPGYGRYVLSLMDRQNRVIDSVNFEVRGMPLLPTDKSDDADKDEINDNSHLSTPWEKPPPE